MTCEAPTLFVLVNAFYPLVSGCMICGGYSLCPRSTCKIRHSPPTDQYNGRAAGALIEKITIIIGDSNPINLVCFCCSIGIADCETLN